jgi:hypothetical protein
VTFSTAYTPPLHPGPGPSQSRHHQRSGEGILAYPALHTHLLMLEHIIPDEAWEFVGNPCISHSKVFLEIINLFPNNKSKHTKFSSQEINKTHLGKASSTTYTRSTTSRSFQQSTQPLWDPAPTPMDTPTNVRRRFFGPQRGYIHSDSGYDPFNLSID